MKHTFEVPDIVLGTMTFGVQADEKSVDQILGLFLDAGYREIDTAYDYGKGKTEELLGRILTPELRNRLHLATKANPWGEGGLSPDSVRSQLEASLRRLRADFADLFYLHAPDRKTPIEITLEGCNQLFREGKFRALGLSNYASWQVVDIWHICQRNGWIMPTVYQGMYNGITRAVEPELFPALRSRGMRFYAYNPLAGGLLTGKHTDYQKLPEGGRFSLLDMYQERYWKKNYFRAVDRIRRCCSKHQISLAESALRWGLFHSMLSPEHRDALIIGASNPEQMKMNLDSVNQSLLSAEIVALYDKAWLVSRPECPTYFRL